MAEIIAVANQKGGVAKTTVVHNLSVALALKKKKVLMVDLDSQASLSFCAGIQNPADYDGNNIVAALEKNSKVDIHDCIQPVGALDELKGYLYLIPSIIDLAQMELEMFSRTSRERILDKALTPVKGEYDYIILDCPPQLSIMTINAFSCADGVIVPVKTDELAYRGLQQLCGSIEEIQNLVNPKLQIYGIIATLFEKAVKTDNDILNRLQKENRVIAVIRKAAIVKKGVETGVSAVESVPTHEVSKAIMEVADMVIQGKLRKDNEK